MANKSQLTITYWVLLAYYYGLLGCGISVFDERTSAKISRTKPCDLYSGLVSGTLDQIIPMAVWLVFFYLGLCVIELPFGVGLAYFILPVLLWPLAISAVFHGLHVPYVCGYFASHAVT